MQTYATRDLPALPMIAQKNRMGAHDGTFLTA